MNREEIIKGFLKDPEYKRICQSLAGDFADDLYQEMAILILEIPEERLVKISQTNLRGYYRNIAWNQLFSPECSFYKKFKKQRAFLLQHEHDIRDGVHSDDLLRAEDARRIEVLKKAMIETNVRKRDWYYINMLELYLEHGTCQKVASITNIPLRSVHNGVKKGKEIVRDKIKRYE